VFWIRIVALSYNGMFYMCLYYHRAEDNNNFGFNLSCKLMYVKISNENGGLRVFFLLLNRVGHIVPPPGSGAECLMSRSADCQAFGKKWGQENGTLCVTV
jgi:hypothetical protein